MDDAALDALKAGPDSVAGDLDIAEAMVAEARLVNFRPSAFEKEGVRGPGVLIGSYVE
jgi:hypothetical protein